MPPVKFIVGLSSPLPPPLPAWRKSFGSVLCRLFAAGVGGVGDDDLSSRPLLLCGSFVCRRG